MGFQEEYNEIVTNEPPKNHKALISELKKKYDIKPKGLFSKKKSK